MIQAANFEIPLHLEHHIKFSTYRDRMTLISKLCCHWFRLWLGAWLWSINWTVGGIQILFHDRDIRKATQISSLTIVYSTVYSGENNKAPRQWPLCGDFTGDRWTPRTNGQSHTKCFHLMTSSWVTSRKSIPASVGTAPVITKCS